MLTANEVKKYLHLDYQMDLGYQDEEENFARVITDSREVQPGDLFVALVGEKFDGHDFVSKAIAAGAKGVIISNDVNVGIGVHKFLVENTLKAYQELAAGYRRSKKNLRVIAITGSNGKTSTKDILAHCLSSKYRVVKTQANFNNEIGLPKTLFNVQDDTEIVVLEMGMRGFNQIRELCYIAKPESGLITNVGVSHIEILGSQENIAKAKSELLDGLTADGFAVLNGDDEYVSKMGEKAVAQVNYFGVKNSNDYYATNIVMNFDGTDFTCNERISGKTCKVHLPILGMHNVYNALSAIAMSVCYGVSMAECAKALESVKLSERRLEIVKRGDLTFIDDSYNANPASMKAALETLKMVKEGSEKTQRCRSIAILADMLELGDIAKKAHEEIGSLCKELGVDYLITYGENAKNIYWVAKKMGVKAQLCEDVKQAYECLVHVVHSGDIILLKGSHSMEVNRVLSYFDE